MNFVEKKREIKSEIDKIDDEKLLWAIARLLHLDDDADIPQWHKEILQERAAEYQKGTTQTKDWDQVKKTL
jgi:hypothetical protein